MSSDGIAWAMVASERTVQSMLYADGAWYGRGGTALFRSDDLATWTQIADEIPGGRDWTAVFVLDSNLPVEGVELCMDNR